jgi:ABC-2 type transport system permease protein
MVNAFRYGVLGVSDIPIGTAYAIIGVALLLLYGFALFLLEKGIGIRD